MNILTKKVQVVNYVKKTLFKGDSDSDLHRAFK